MNTLYDKMIESSAEYIRRLITQNLSQNTMNNYRTVLNLFCEFLKENEQPDEFSAVVAWKTQLFENGLAPSTIKQYLIDLQIFFSAVSHRSYPVEIRFGENPIDKTLLPKIPDRPYPIILTDEQIIKLYQDKPPMPQYKPMWARTYAVLMILLNEKIRVSELTELRLSDLDFRDHILIVRSGKGRRYREVDLCELSEFAIERYLDEIRPPYLPDDDYLFGNTAPKEKISASMSHEATRWHKFSSAGISDSIERVIYAITGVKKVRAHDLRKIGSRVCLNAGQSIEELQGQLGHSQITTTQIYTSRMGSRRSRDSAREVLAARDEAAKKLKEQNKRRAGQNLVPLFA